MVFFNRLGEVVQSSRIDEKEEVFVIPFRELEAVVSKVPLEEFTSEEIQSNKRKGETRWL